MTSTEKVVFAVGLVIMASGVGCYEAFGTRNRLDCERATATCTVEAGRLHGTTTERIPLARLRVSTEDVAMAEDETPRRALVVATAAGGVRVSDGHATAIAEQEKTIAAFTSGAGTEPRLTLERDRRAIGLSAGVPPLFVGLFLVWAALKKPKAS